MGPRDIRSDLGKDEQVIGTHASNPVASAFLTLLAIFLLALFLWPNKPKQSETLTKERVAEFQVVFDRIERLDQQIAQLDRKLASLGGTKGLIDGSSINQYYEGLTMLQEMHINRARLAKEYNGMALNLFARQGGIPYGAQNIRIAYRGPINPTSQRHSNAPLFCCHAFPSSQEDIFLKHLSPV